MAVTAKFIADFTSFHAAVQKAEIELRSFESGANKVGGSLNRMADSFSGRKTIQEAALMEKAIGGIAGVSKLTESELRRVNATVSEAVEKFRALGQTAPPGMTKLAEATKGASQSTSLLGTGIVALAGAFTLAKVAVFATDLVNAVGRLQDLHERTGFSVEALQRFKSIADQSGSSIDDVASAAFQLSKRISIGDDSTRAAVEKLGLSFTALLSMNQEERFQAVGQAVGALKDPLAQAELGSAAFGRSVDGLIPTLKHLGEESRRVATLSAGQVALIDALGDAWVRFKGSLVPVTVAMIDNTLRVSQSIAIWQKWFGAVNPDETSAAFKRLTVSLQANTDAVKSRAAQVLTGTALEVRSKYALEEINEALAAKKKRLKEAEDATEKYNEVLKASAKALRAFHNEVGVQFIKDVEAADKATLEAASALRKFNNEIGVQHIQDIQNTNKATLDVAAAMRALHNELGVIRMELEARLFGHIGPEMDVLIKQTQTFTQELDVLAGTLVQLAQVSGESFGGLVKAVAQGVVAINGAAKALEVYSSTATHTIAQNAAMAASWMTMSFTVVNLAASFLEMSKAEQQAMLAARSFKRELADLATAAQLTEAQIGASSQHRRQAASKEEISLIVLRDLYEDLGLAATKAAHDFKLAMGGDQGAIDNIRDNIAAHHELIAAAHAMGSFTRDELQAVADKAKKVFEFMTQDGRYSAEQLAKAWADFEEKQAIALGGPGVMDAFGKAKDAVNALQARYKTLSDSVAKEAPEKVMGTIEKAARAEMAVLQKQMDANRKQMDADAQALKASLEKALGSVNVKPVVVPIVWKVPPMPSGNVSLAQPRPTQGFAGGTHGKFLDFGSGTDVRLHGREAVVTEGEVGSGGGGTGDLLSAIKALHDEVAGQRRDFKFTIPNALAKAQVTAKAKAGV